MTLQTRWPGVNGITGTWHRIFSKFDLSKGKNVLTVHILTNGNMNLAYFDFKQIHK